MEIPYFKHECSMGCVFLGEYRLGEEGYETSYDLYFCPQHDIPTVLARYDHGANDYVSGMEFGKSGLNPALHEAYKRACERDLIKPHVKAEVEENAAQVSKHKSEANG